MIQRVVVVRLKPEVRDQAATIAAHARQVLGSVPMVRELRVGVAADAHTGREWDLVIALRLDDLAAVEAWRVDETHRAFADVYLKPLREGIRVWNFGLVE